MQLETLDYNYGMARTYAERSDREALLWSVLKWLKLGTIHENRLRDAWHTICGLCWRYAGGKVDNCAVCPLALAGYRCYRYRGSDSGNPSPWQEASEAYDSWSHLNSEQSFKKFRKEAQKFTMILARIYNDTYPDRKIIVDFGRKELRSVTISRFPLPWGE